MIQLSSKISWGFYQWHEEMTQEEMTSIKLMWSYRVQNATAVGHVTASELQGLGFDPELGWVHGV